jgi:hypothetical protein
MSSSPRRKIARLAAGCLILGVGDEFMKASPIRLRRSRPQSQLGAAYDDTGTNETGEMRCRPTAWHGNALTSPGVADCGRQASGVPWRPVYRHYRGSRR